MNAAGYNISSALILIVGTILLVPAVVWFIFPFIVNSALNRIQKLLVKQNQLLEWFIEKDRK